MSRRTGDEGGDGGFLDRWSRRKRDAAQAAKAPATKPAPQEPEGDEAPVDAEFIANLPAIDDITADTDLTPFVRRGVPQALRNAALRKVWAADPAIRDHVDVALDYAWDWNAAGGVPGGGGTLTADGVTKMVRDLIGRTEAAAPDAQAATADSAPDDSAESSTSETGPQQPDEASPDPRKAVRPVAVAKTDAPMPETRQSAAPAPRRRHGGATPG
ncbi:MAG: DUF3306 domain-containing protein [Inquilinaceae bacterium]